MKSLFLVAGEISGDNHGSALMHSLQELGVASMSGLGGPKMEEISSDIEDWLDEAAVLGLWEVLKKYRYFQSKMEATVNRILTESPDGVILIDYPGFNLRLARRLRDEGYTGKLIYYISPQVWAWKKGRIKTMAELLDLMICIFPFEKPLYEESGLPTVFAGHPLADSMEAVRDPEIVRDNDLIALLPGSREREIVKLYPVMLEAAKILSRDSPNLKFATSGATKPLTDLLQTMTDEAGLGDKVEVREKGAYRIMQEASVGAVASGTATLEAACLGLPYCLVYKVVWLTAFAARRLMSVKYLGIVNVLADREVVKELLQGDATGESLARELKSLYSDSERREALEKDLSDTVGRLTDSRDAHQRAAKAVLAAWE